MERGEYDIQHSAGTVGKAKKSKKGTLIYIFHLLQKWTRTEFKCKTYQTSRSGGGEWIP